MFLAIFQVNTTFRYPYTFPFFETTSGHNFVWAPVIEQPWLRPLALADIPSRSLAWVRAG